MPTAEINWESYVTWSSLFSQWNVVTKFVKWIGLAQPA